MPKKIKALLFMIPLVALCGWMFWVFWFLGKDHGGRELFMILMGTAALGAAVMGTAWLFGKGWRLLFGKEEK